jgi:mannose-1-phosphate guanylyltransferase
MNSIYAVILAGGSGTRFWPASRALHPKQLLALAGSTQPSLIASTLERLSPIVPNERIYVATGRHLVDATRIHLPTLPAEAFLAEPAPRNTAPCIGWATRVIARRDPNATILVVPSDQHVVDQQGFEAAVQTAIASAQTGVITTIGIEPTRAETGYGYIEIGASVSDRVSRITRFVEKPDRARAEEYLRSKRYLWNSGMFFYQAQVMSDAIARHLPEIAAGLDAIDRAAAQGKDAEFEALSLVFPKLSSISIDFGVLEHASTLNVVRSNFGWSDLGNFASVWEHQGHDERGNAVPSGSVLVDAERTLVFDARSSDARRVIALLGTRDLCVILTDDAVLVMPRDRAEDVRAVVDQLKAAGRGDLL